MKLPNIKQQCPNCQSEKTNQVSRDNYFCLDCGVEFNFKNSKVFSIMYDGSLVDYYVNEFMDIV
jgi:transposase-like protein